MKLYVIGRWDEDAPERHFHIDSNHINYMSVIDSLYHHDQVTLLHRI